MTHFATNSAHAGHAAGRVGLVYYVGLVLAAPLSALLLSIAEAPLAMALCAFLPLVGVIVARFTAEVRPSLEQVSTDQVGENEEVTTTSAKEREVGETAGETKRPGSFVLTSGMILALSAVTYGTLVTVRPRQIPAGSALPQAGLLAIYGAVLVLVRVVAPKRWNRFFATPAGVVLALVAEGVDGCVMWAGTVATSVVGAGLIGVSSAMIYSGLITQIVALAGRFRAHAAASFGSFTVLGYGAGSLVAGFVTEQGSAPVAFLVAGVVALVGVAFVPLWVRFAGGAGRLA